MERKAGAARPAVFIVAKGRFLQQSVPTETSRRLDAFQFGKVKIADSPQGLRGWPQ